jgi:hypothetical protein
MSVMAAAIVSTVTRWVDPSEGEHNLVPSPDFSYWGENGTG